MNCIKCRSSIQALRLKALPDTKECVKCSSEERNMVRAVITGKTTYSEVEVIKNKKTKEYLNDLIGKGRRGFGSMLYRGSGSDQSHTSVKINTGNTGHVPRITSRKDFEFVGKKMMMYIEAEDIDGAKNLLKQSLVTRRINGAQFYQLNNIMENIYENGVGY